jgi:formate dehydrogenase major subunit
MPPLGQSRPDWQILTDLAARMGHNWGYTHPSQIMREVAGIAKIFAGVSYERLEGWKSLHWPVAEDGTDTPLLYTERFHMPEGKAVLYPVQWQAPAEAADAEYDLILDNGRMLEQFQAMNQTGRGPRVWSLSPKWFVEVSPELARERGIEDGSWLRITSRRGSLEVPALVTDRVSGRNLFLPLHHGKPGLNKLTGEHHDPDVNTPAYKEIAVKVEILEREKDAPPLPERNFRFGHRTPIAHVPVDEKWHRETYIAPPEPIEHPERL